MSPAESPASPAAEMANTQMSGEKVFYLVALVLVVIGAAMTLLFGLPGLAMTALALVPVVYALLILLSVGK
ncbi:hypothetical protein [Antarctobacter heliothermus]|uniref:Uncharacterized protein n=1 Tax=Antarctobacter heliothermus TaxID=74033 RepID=A0A239B939_9RHOB|nr:hypothetical protein [Antarctobacter heliothermus]SNS04446.1 hypothetical protein SAMN04488078_1002160 [Antarctobacter heliothermus]